MIIDDENVMKKSMALTIYRFAMAHAATAFALSQTMVGDEIMLNTLTITMIKYIAKTNHKKWNASDVQTILQMMAGNYIGTRLGLSLIKWIPGLGNGANASSAFTTAKKLGWITYLLTKQDKNPSELTDIEKKRLLHDAQKLLNNNIGEEIYNKIESIDQKRLNNLILQSTKASSSTESVQEELFLQLEETVENSISKIDVS